MPIKNTRVILICGSLLTEKLEDVIVGISHQLPPEKRGKTWQIFPGTGTGGTILDVFFGLLHGGIGKNNCYESAENAAQWVSTSIGKDETISEIIIVAYSRGCNIANRTARLLSYSPRLQHIPIVLIDHDNVAGLFGSTDMVPRIASNVNMHVRFNAQFSLKPVFPFFLTHHSTYENCQTKKLYFTVPFDHAAASGTKITFWDHKDFFLQQEKTIQPLWLGLLCLALQKSGVEIQTKMPEETIMAQWHDFSKTPEKYWKKTFLHRENLARDHTFEESLWKRLPLFVLLIASSLFLTEFPYNIALLAITACLMCKTIQLIADATTLVSKTGIPLASNINLFLNHFAKLTEMSSTSSIKTIEITP